MTSPAAAERSALCDLFLEVGPDAPTLCAGWTTRDLAAHLVVRERRPDAAAGIVLRPLAGYSEKVRRTEAARPWDELVELVRRGPPRWNPMRVDAVDRLANSIEFFVHHEDVRRARAGWVPRAIDLALEDALATSVGHGGRLLTRKVGVGIVLEPVGRPRIELRAGTPTVAIRGPLPEGVLYLYGRKDVAQVALDGPADAVATVRATQFGL
jgi:uncharacterized protein (TIGR03085 family)